MKLDFQLVYLALGPCDVDDLHPRDGLLQLQNLRAVAARSKRIKRSFIDTWRRIRTWVEKEMRARTLT